jgi:hypothetical protein
VIGRQIEDWHIMAYGLLAIGAPVARVARYVGKGRSTIKFAFDIDREREKHRLRCQKARGPRRVVSVLAPLFFSLPEAAEQ